MGAMQQLLISYGAAGGGGGGHIAANLVMHLDAANISSFPGTGTVWANLVTSPADGSAQTDYNWTRGVGPGFVGTAGGMSSGEYFEVGGTEFFSLAAGASGPALLKNMHKAGQAWTFEIWFLTTGTVGNVAPFFDSGSSDQGGSDLSRGVIGIDQGTLNQTAGRHKWRIRRDAGGASAYAVESDAAITNDVVNMLALSYDSAGTSFLYRNGAYDPVGGNDTFMVSLSSPGSSDPTNAPRLGARGDGAVAVKLNSRFYIVRLYNAALSKADLDTNWNANRGRYGL